MLMLISFILTLTTAAFPSLAFVRLSDTSSRQRSTVQQAITSPNPLDQIKLDFIGSLENAYDLNPTNSASTSFLNHLVKQATPESITRNMIESFEQLSIGKWRIVYIEEYTTSFGFGSLFGDISGAEIEIGSNGSISSNIQCSNPNTTYQLSVNGNFGTARNNMIIKVDNVESIQMMQIDENDGLLSELKGVPTSITQTIIEKSWPKLFSGVVVIDLAFIDDNLAVFDLDFLARVNGKRICARKEPDFF